MDFLNTGLMSTPEVFIACTKVWVLWEPRARSQGNQERGAEGTEV